CRRDGSGPLGESTAPGIAGKTRLGETSTVKITWIRAAARGLLALSTLWMLAGCGGQDSAPSEGPLPSPASGTSAAPPAGEGPRLLFISNGNSDWWSAVEKGMIDGGSKFGARVELRRNDGQPEGQIKLLEDALALPDVKGVAVSVLEA